ncbi:MAG: MCE family protein, partial [Alistipes sp.]|nr:MCE family protein [Alistipes sp.]
MKKEVKVGLFAIAVLLVGWGVARMLKGAEIFSNSYTYYAYYTQVGGIQPASHVMISGVKVGSVVDVKLN